MAISRSLGVVTVNLAGPIDGLAHFASTFFLLRSHFFEQRIQPLEISFPELAVALEPFVGFGESPGLQPPWTSLRIAATRDQAGAFEPLEMFRNRRLAHGERLGQLVHRGIARGKPRKDCPAGAIRERREDSVQLPRSRYSIT